MQYFSTLPKIIQTDSNKNSVIVTNLLARASILPKVLLNPMIYYTYDIQDGDTPEIIAHKYYGDSYRYWVILFANQLLDPQWNWPMNGQVFNSYLTDKYGNTDIYNTVHHYEQVTTQLDVSTNITTVNTITIDEDTYNSLVTSTSNVTLPTGTVTVTVTKNAVSIYNYELETNESRRNIRIMNNNYVGQLEKEFQKLMAK